MKYLSYFKLQPLSSHKKEDIFFKTLKFLPLIFLIHHALLWIVTIYSREKSAVDALAHWDSEWYISIMTNGYNLKSIAFYPLYPSIIKTLSYLFPQGFPLQYIGSLFSLILFSFFCFFIVKFAKNSNNNPSWLIPQTFFGYFFFIYAPVSYIFHSNHTESLYLILSFFALYFSNKNWVIASIFAGFCALTKNQGVILSISIAFLSASMQIERIHKVKIFILSGIISSFFYSLFLIYQYIQFSNPFAFIDAQKNWDHISSATQYFNVFFDIQNYEKNTRFINYEIIYYYMMIAGSFLLLKKSKAIFFYVLFSLLLLPFQTSLINAFRYSIFLFPLIFTLGDYLANKNKFLLICLFIFMIYLNHQMARNYVLERWSY